MESSFFWLGNSVGDSDCDAHYADGCVWIGRMTHISFVTIENSEYEADARYECGCVWLGSRVRSEYEADARYSDGLIWLGSCEGSEWEADAHYADGCVWIGGMKHVAFVTLESSEYEADARYDGPDDGAAAAAVLLLLMDACSTDAANEDEEGGNCTSASSDYENAEDTSSDDSHASAQTYLTHSPSIGDSWVLLPIAVLLLILIGSMFFSTATNTGHDTQVVAPAATERDAPNEIVDHGVCPYEGCKYDEQWKASLDVNAYASPPQSVGAPLDKLPVKMVIRAGEWARTITGCVLAQRRRGRLGDRMVYLYSYLGEGFWRGWVDGRLQVVNNATLLEDADHEWWIEVRTQNGLHGWVLSNRSFMTQEEQNNQLARTVSSQKLALQDKLLEVDTLLKNGAEINGDSGEYGSPPLEAAIGTRDTALLKELISRGLVITNDRFCAARSAAWYALKPDGALLLDYLLKNGMSLDCLTEPPLHAFLIRGIALDSYPVESAVRVAEVLISHGASIYELNSEGRSILDELDEWEKRRDWLGNRPSEVELRNAKALRQALELITQPSRKTNYPGG